MFDFLSPHSESFLFLFSFISFHLFVCSTTTVLTQKKHSFWVWLDFIRDRWSAEWEECLNDRWKKNNREDRQFKIESRTSHINTYLGDLPYFGILFKVVGRHKLLYLLADLIHFINRIELKWYSWNKTEEDDDDKKWILNIKCDVRFKCTEASEQDRNAWVLRRSYNAQ